eukprot:TRINITY_DN1846_c0_g1_i1.p1 TRINITY_DN1846_c0_g1~~TRINITY_DN1846_c0_g1_i1.p1  ORF type:complete len:1292 (+),score=330.90 TRINITY_DN1846_c0_g1_i1:83-3877(+)
MSATEKNPLPAGQENVRKNNGTQQQSWREKAEEEKKAPREEGSWVSKVNYSYINPLLALGWTRPLNAEDLPPLADNDTTHTQHRKLLMGWNKVKGTGSDKWRFWRALYHAFKEEFYLSAFYAFGESACVIGQPVLLGYLLTWFKGDDSDLLEGSLLTAGFVACSFLVAVIHHQLFYYGMRTGWCCRMGCTALIHEKLLHSSYSGRMAHTNGKIMNLVSTDVLRFDQGMVYVQFMWVSLLDCVVCYYLMSVNVGYGPAAAGVGVLAMVSLMQLNSARFLSRFRHETAQATDKRVSLTAQLLSGMLSVKAALWETPFQKMVSRIRRTEASWILKSQLVKAFNLGIYFSAPALASFAIFSIYIYVNGQRLEIDSAYPTIALLQALRFSMGKKLSRALEAVPEMHVAILRIQEFLEAGEDNGVSDHPLPRGESTVLHIENMSCSWEEGDDVVSGLNLKVAKGEMATLSGAVGCGKSTVLSAILSEAAVTKGSVRVRGPVAYCPQSPWIIAGTVRDNIVFGSTFEEERYHQVLQATCIDTDMKQLQNGDLTEIGERGVNLSGGQKARVSLARALYSDACLLLLDDPLAAVDPCVCDALLESLRAILSLEKVGILLVSHQPKAASYSNCIVTLTDEGTVSYHGSPHEPIAAAAPTTVLKPQDETTDENEKENENEEENEKEERDAAVKLVETEDRARGAVTGTTYAEYIKAGGRFLATVVLVGLFSGQLSMMYGDYFLSSWADNDLNEQQNHFYLAVYGGVCASTFSLGLMRAFLFFFITVRANSYIHDSSFASVLRTKMSFFTSNPLGRIINRFSADLGQIDEQLPVLFFDTLQMAFMVLGVMVLVCIAIPWIAIALPFLIGIFVWLRAYATSSLRELKRLDGVSRSPVFAAFSANLNGITSIKAFQKQDEIQHAFGMRLEAMAKPWYWWFIGNRWIGFRLDIMCAVLVTLLSGMGLVLKDTVSTSVYALALTYSLSLGETLQYMARNSSLVETMMTSVERLLYYTSLPPEEEEGCLLQIKTMDEEWPRTGAIRLANLSVRYRSDLPVVLQGMTVDIPQGSRVGVVGRTGSGKSSFFQSLLGLNEVVGGQVFLDGKDVAAMPLQQRRSAITLIPQEPVLFTGTVRYNLDPFEECSDDDLWGVLEKVQLKETFSSLDDLIAEGGANLSTGHRQLFSLARCMLCKARVVLIDEGTANVDFSTDKIIQAAIRDADVFKEATIVTIAHRMETIADSTLILALDKGKLVEVGAPGELMERCDGLYRSMVVSRGK